MMPEATSALSWIPQIFYDLIGRVFPGVAVLVSSLLLFQDSAKAKSLVFFLFKDSGAPLSVTVLIGLVLSYLVGVLLGALGFFFQGNEWNIRPPALSIHECPDLRRQELLRSFMYDAVQLHDPQAGARLAKLAAEQHMCRVLIVGFVALGFLQTGLYVAGTRPGTFWAAIALFSVVVFSSWLFHRHLAIRAARLLANQWWSLELASKTRASMHVLDCPYRESDLG
ncbi:MAG TPA: hypothetical protein VHR45_14830 [Thermoanaerobaculia bacterium]|nr:hypothetical protein [Thermoanaerobaculia bacterium]